MTEKKSPKPTRTPSTLAFATRVAALVSGLEPETQKALADKHAARTRKPRSVKAMPSVKVSPTEPLGYLRAGPTRSRVLNAFLHEARALALLPPDCPVLLDEHALAPRLVEISRKYLAPMAAAAGNVEAAFRLLSELSPVTTERGAELVLRRALTISGPLGAIARDYEAHRQRASQLPHDALVTSAIFAAFAGRCVSLAANLLGSHVRDEVQTALRHVMDAHTEPSGEAPSRKARVRASVLPDRGEHEHDRKKRSAG